MKAHWWRWKLSSEDDPLPHLSTFRTLPPFWSVPVFVYNSTCGGSWMHSRCFCCISQTWCMLSGLTRRNPVVSVSSHTDSSSPEIMARISSALRVRRLQCFASSPGLMLTMSCASVGACPPWLLFHSPLLAALSSFTSSWSHSKIQEEKVLNKRYRKRVVLCSKATVESSHKWKISSLK